jgi:hypothetical protein
MLPIGGLHRILEFGVLRIDTAFKWSLARRPRNRLRSEFERRYKRMKLKRFSLFALSEFKKGIFCCRGQPLQDMELRPLHGGLSKNKALYPPEYARISQQGFLRVEAGLDKWQ